MADQEDPKAEASAEKAYAAAAEVVIAGKSDAEADLPVVLESAPPVEAPAPAPVEFPAKAKRAVKPAAVAVEAAPAAPVVAAAPALPKPRKPVKKAIPAVKVAAKRAAPKKVAAAKPAPAKKLPPVTVKISKPTIAASAKAPVVTPIKEKLMDKTSDFVDGVQKVAADTQAKAKKAFEKSGAVFGEYAEFAKGNVAAVVESGKILATGLQGIGSSMVAEGKTAFETATADVKQLAAVKSPGEFFKLHTDILRRNFDSAIKLTSKNGETMMKLATDSFAPISGRVTLAVDKLRTAA